MKNVFSGKKAVLFDLDGVVLDTESQYTLFWKGLCKDFFPDDPGLGLRIKVFSLQAHAGCHHGACESVRSFHAL